MIPIKCMCLTFQVYAACIFLLKASLIFILLIAEKIFFFHFDLLLLFVVVQSLSCVWLFATPWTAACQASLSFIISLTLLKLMSTEAVMPSNHFILCCLFLLLPSIFPSIRILSKESAPKTSSGQRIGTSASVLWMNVQGWFPLGLTHLISLLSRGLSRVFSSITIWKLQFFALSLIYGPALTSIYDYYKKHSFDYTNFGWQSDMSAI